MKRFVVALFAVVACRTVSTPAPSPSGTGSLSTIADARSSIDRYLAAVKDQDLQAMAVAWGTSKGPARDDKSMSEQELYKREIIQICYLMHDRFRVTDAPRVRGDSAFFSIELTKGTLTRQTTFHSIRGPSRWYVMSFDVAPLKDFCANPPPGDPREP